MPGLNATFVDVGYDKDAFLHYLDLGSNFHSIAQFTKTLVNDRKKNTFNAKKILVYLT